MKRSKFLAIDGLESRQLLDSAMACELFDGSPHSLVAEVADVGGLAGASIASTPLAKVGEGVIIRTESAVVPVNPTTPQTGAISVFLEVPLSANYSASGYETSLHLVGNPTGVRFTGVQLATGAHPALFPSQLPIVNSIGSRLRVTDFLLTGDAPVQDGAGLFKAEFVVDPGVSGVFPIEFETLFTNIADRSASAVPIDALLAGTITVGTPTAPTISINDVSLTEGNSGTKTATFTVSLSRVATTTISVDYSTSAGTATMGGDFLSAGGRLTFSPGQTTKSVTVTINGDLAVEPDETFFVNLTSAVGATMTDNLGLGTIINDDVALAHPWRNPINPLDVNGDGNVTPVDALLVINRINQAGPGPLPVPPVAPNVPPPYLDPSGDDNVSAVDALLVINEINRLAGLSASFEEPLAKSGAPSDGSGDANLKALALAISQSLADDGDE